MQLNINTDAAVIFTNKLEQLHKSALPSAIRGALNRAVFDVKKTTMPQEASASFQSRQKNFFKANSKFENAKGFNISTMQSTVGFYSNNLLGNDNYAVKDLEQQEHGGDIGGKAFIPMKAARVGGKGKVRANARLADLISNKKIVSASKTKSVGTRFLKQKFIRAAIKAKSLNPDNAFVLGNIKNGSQTLFRINELWTGTRGANQGFGSRKLMIQLVPLYRVKRGRHIHIGKATGFMKRASLSTSIKMEEFYIIEAKRQLAKLFK